MKRYAVTVLVLLSFLFPLMVLHHRTSDALDTVPDGWVGIYDREGLEAISTAPEKQYILMNDIDLSASEWTALCSSDAPFVGTLDGNGHTVYGMTVSDSVNACGLISYLSGGTITSLRVMGTASGPMAGLVVGKAGSGTIRDCTAEGTVNSDFFGGGICGQIRGQGVTVTGCTSSVKLSGTAAAESELFLGGICGGVFGNGQVISHCEFTGTLSPGGNRIFAGGIAGEVSGSASDTLSVVSCHSKGALSLASFETATVGGVVGRLNGGNISLSDCSFEGSWGGGTCSSTLVLGGIVGSAEASATTEISQCRSFGSLSGAGHPDYQKDSAGDYRCTACSVSLGKTTSENYGMVIGHMNLDVSYPASVGGIIGSGLANGGTLTVSRSASSVTVSATGTPVLLGGIVGSNRSDEGSALVTDCFFGGRIRYPSPPHGEISSCVGGIAGCNVGFATATVQRCIALARPEHAYTLGTGAIVGISGSFYVGDGVPDNAVSVQSCYTYSANDPYGTALSGVQMENPESFVGFDFTSHWQINPATGLPNPQGALISPSVLPLGDVDGSGIVTRSDAELLVSHLSGNLPLTAAQLQRSDVDADGTVDSRDVTKLLQMTIS